MTVDNPEATVEAADPNPEPVDLGDAGKKALAAERARADKAEKALKALQAEAEERANAELTELERFKKEADELRAAKTKSDLDAIRYAVALDKGIPASLAARLRGDDREAIEADAEALAALVNTTPPGPRPDHSQGPKQTVGKQSPAQAFAALIGEQLK
jgi:Xaa-Pro aminopeptidase